MNVCRQYIFSLVQAWWCVGRKATCTRAWSPLSAATRTCTSSARSRCTPAWCTEPWQSNVRENTGIWQYACNPQENRSKEHWQHSLYLYRRIINVRMNIWQRRTLQNTTFKRATLINMPGAIAPASWRQGNVSLPWNLNLRRKQKLLKHTLERTLLLLGQRAKGLQVTAHLHLSRLEWTDFTHGKKKGQGQNFNNDRIKFDFEVLYQ